MSDIDGVNEKNDYLHEMEQYNDIKEIGDLIKEVEKLREYYYTQQYDNMHRHINYLTVKYLSETLAWNSSHRIMPVTAQQSYTNAEYFLRLKGLSLLIQKGKKIKEPLTTDEMEYIESVIKA